jgi:hypothetical protein
MLYRLKKGEIKWASQLQKLLIIILNT